MNLKLLCFLLCFPFISSQDSGNFLFHESKISRGRNTNISEVSYQTAVEAAKTVVGNACLISAGWLVSGATALLDIIQNKQKAQIRVGSSFKLTGGSVHDVEKITLNPSFNKYTSENDLALIQLTKPVRFSKFVGYIRFAGPKTVIKPNTNVKISGFGNTEFNVPGSRQVQSVVVQTLSNADCSRQTIATIHENQFCISTKKATTCPGDRGASAVINKILVGIVSYGTSCSSSKPTVLTRISAFSSWISSVTGIRLFKKVRNENGS